MLASARNLAVLARWLGPWASERRAPAAAREEVSVPPAAAGEAPFAARAYAPRGRAPDRAFLIAPGLHYAGPDDPRLDRFCAVLAGSGALVLAPFLPSYTSLRVRPSSLGELDRAFGALLAHRSLPPGRRPVVFSISFGSLPALRLAASPERAEALESLIVFGGYADFARTIDFCLSGEIEGEPHTTHDPLNRPVAVLNMLEWIDEAPPRTEPVVRAWRRFVEATWGRPEMKAPERWQPLARRIAAELPAEERDLFLRGCGVLPGARAMCRRALERAGEGLDFLDPRPHLGGLRRPVYVVHGMDDDVIPHVEARALAEAIGDRVPVRLLLTGLFGHTGKAGAAPAALARELATLVRLLRVLGSGEPG